MNVPKCNTELKKMVNINEFEMAILLNKRASELMHGAKPLIETRGTNVIELAIHELLAGKIKEG
jgi:DNA-directed RNA polymerase subunit K/omega